MSTLAKAAPERLEVLLRGLGDLPAYGLLRRPETGLTMLRARIGGDGAPFNLGEATVTRCAVQLDDGTVGHAYVQGRRPRHAELAALADALLQQPDRHAAVAASVVAVLEAEAGEAARAAAARSAATRVEFFTISREGGG